MNPFWQRLQSNKNEYFNDLHIKAWNTSVMTNLECDDDKVHMHHMIATDNARRVRHVRDNRAGIVCHTLAFSSTAILVGFEYETQNDTKTKATLRLMQNTRAPIGAELSLNHVKMR